MGAKILFFHELSTLLCKNYFKFFCFFTKSIIFALMTQVSGFILSSEFEVSETFTEISELSTSGFNVLFRAKRNGQWWILKSLKPDVCHDSTFLQLQQKEYDILARLDHPGIVKVKGLEEVEGYGRCIVMEWIDGVTLDEWLTQRHSGFERRQIARQLLQVMEYVHDQQIVHRDLKPANIMIARNGGTIKLIDFGLSDADSYTILKSPAGTEGYVSPEQQEESVPDVRNDIYSLGVILKEMRLGWSCRWAVKRCFLPLEYRYPNVLALRMHIQSLHRRLIALNCLLAFLVLGTSGIVLYNKVVKPEILYDVVAQFTVGNLVYKSWGGGLVTVSAANDRDSVIEIPATVKYQGVSYRVDELEDSAFAVHPFLKRVVMPDNPKLHVMKHIFDGSPNLESIYFRSKTPPRLGNAIWKVTMDDIFKPLSFGKVILYVPQGSKDAYRRSPWGRFVYIVEFEK